MVTFMIKSQYEKITPFTKVLGIDIQLAGLDPFGAVREGSSITLHGPLLRLGTVDTLKAAAQATPAYPILMTRLSPLLPDLVADGYGESSHAQEVGLLMLLEQAADKTTRRVCLLVLLEAEGGDGWRRINLLVLRTRGVKGVAPEETGKSLAILREIRGDMRKETVRIV